MKDIGVIVNETTQLIHIKKPEDVKALRLNEKKAQRGCECIDMGGYRIYSTHVTIRKKLFLRIRRAFLRAWREIQNTNVMPHKRAATLISYFGFIKQTKSQHFIEKYHVNELLHIAKKVSSSHSKKYAKERKERLYDIVKRSNERYARFCAA
jgi:hypothetical protein